VHDKISGISNTTINRDLLALKVRLNGFCKGWDLIVITLYTTKHMP